MKKKEEKHPVPGEGNMVYPEDKDVPVQGEVKDPKIGLQEQELVPDSEPKRDEGEEQGD